MMKFTLPPVVCRGQYHNTESIMATVEHVAITPRAMMGPQWHSLFNSWRFSNLITEHNAFILGRKNAFLLLQDYRFPFSVYTFACATSPHVFPDCHAFELWRLCHFHYSLTACYFNQENPVSWFETQPKENKRDSSVENFYLLTKKHLRASPKHAIKGWVLIKKELLLTYIKYSSILNGM